MIELLAGAIVMGYIVAGLFFLKYWRRTHDALLGCFAAAFFILALQRAALALVADQEAQTGLYVLRLVAFMLILVGIWHKNRSSERG
jgi:hypothetical protein